MQGSRPSKLQPQTDRTRIIVSSIVFGTLLYMMVWSLTSPPHVHRVTVQESTSSDGVVTRHEELSCSTGDLAWNYPILCIEALLLCYTMLLAYDTRKMNRALIDGKQMSYVIYNFLFWGVTLFILFLALELQTNEPALAFFVVCLACFLCYVVSLCILLLPKLIKAFVIKERRLSLSDFMKTKNYTPQIGRASCRERV